MSFDLGALVTRMVVQGRSEFEREVNAGGAALTRAGKQGDDFSRALATSSARSLSLGTSVGLAGRELVNLGERGQIALTRIGTGLTVAGLAIGALVGLSVAKYAEYDAAISHSIAVTGAYGEELTRVRDLTQQLGASSVFTATEAAEGVTELGKAGIATSDILGGALAGSLSLAAAGELSVADAAAITATTLTQFHVRGQLATHVSDLLAAAAGKAQGSVGDLGLALKQSGLVANQMGLSVEDTTGTLAAFASAGLIGSDAGTSFRTMLLSLATPTAQQRDLLKQYNIEAYDQQGNFVGITALAGQLKTGFAGATQAQRDFALGTIFGSDAIRSANVLYNEGSDGIRQWIGAVDEAGYAAKVAGINQDNLRGDIEKLGGAFDTSLIKIGGGANGVLRELIQNVTGLVNGFSQLPDWMQQVILGGAALTAGVLLLAGATTVGISRMLEFRASMAVIRAEMPLTGAALSRVSSFLAGPWGIAIAAATLGVHLLDKYLTGLQSTSEEMQASLKSSTTAAQLLASATKGMDDPLTAASTIDQLKDLNNVLQVGVDQDTNALAKLDSSFFQAFNTLKKMGTELATLAKNDLPSAQHAFQLMAAETDGSRSRLWQLLSQMPDFRDELIVQATTLGTYNETMSDAQKQQALLDLAMASSADASKTAADAYTDAAAEVSGLEDNLSSLLDVLNKSNSTNQDAITTNLEYRDTLAKVDDAIAQARAGHEGFANTLDENTQAGRDNKAMLVDLAQSAWDAAQAQLAVDGNTTAFQQTLENSRDALIQRATDMGYSAEQAAAFADQVLRIPSKVETQAILDTAQAVDKLKELQSLYSQAARLAGVAHYEGSTLVNAAPARPRAYGAIDFMAAGGVRSNAGQLAQIRQAGDVTVWAESDTGGEAYIPFALDRRARSEAILAQVASMFGGTYVPAGARGMAAGGVSGAGSASGEMHIRGTLDLGGGLFGYVDGVVEQRLDKEADARGNELR